MKIFISFTTLLILLSIQSCKDDKLVEFARDVIEHPQTLYDLQKNYPEFYNSDYIYTKWQDSTKIAQIIEGITMYDNVDADANISFQQADKGWEVMLNRAKADYTLQDYYLLIFQKKERQVIFYLIKHEDKYYVHFISGGVDAQYLYFHQGNN